MVQAPVPSFKIRLTVNFIDKSQHEFIESNSFSDRLVYKKMIYPYVLQNL